MIAAKSTCVERVLPQSATDVIPSQFAWSGTCYALNLEHSLWFLWKLPHPLGSGASLMYLRRSFQVPARQRHAEPVGQQSILCAEWSIQKARRRKNITYSRVCVSDAICHQQVVELPGWGMEMGTNPIVVHGRSRYHCTAREPDRAREQAPVPDDQPLHLCWGVPTAQSRQYLIWPSLGRRSPDLKSSQDSLLLFSPTLIAEFSPKRHRDQ